MPKSLKSCPKVQKIAKSGHTAQGSLHCKERNHFYRSPLQTTYLSYELLTLFYLIFPWSWGRKCYYLLLNWPTPASFSFIFFFSNTHYNFTTNRNVKKCPSSIWCRDSNSRPLELESPPTTTRPGLPPPFRNVISCYILRISHLIHPVLFTNSD